MVLIHQLLLVIVSDLSEDRKDPNHDLLRTVLVLKVVIQEVQTFQSQVLVLLP